MAVLARPEALLLRTVAAKARPGAVRPEALARAGDPAGAEAPAVRPGNADPPRGRSALRIVTPPASRAAARRAAAESRTREAGAAREARRAAQHEARLWRAYRAARRRSASSAAVSPGTVGGTAPARCDAARNALVEHYQPLVRVIAGALERRLPRRVERGDLETAANVGLMSAIEAFDPARGVPFELYAEHRVRGALLDELRNQDWLPRPWRARLEARRRAVESLRAGLGREPWDEEVAAALSVPLHEYLQDYGAALLEGPGGPGSLEDGGACGVPALDGVPDLCREAPEERLTRDDLLRLVAQKLTVQEYRLVYLKYWEDMPLREIGTLLGLSESRVCKIHMALLDRLRDKLGSDRDR